MRGPDSAAATGDSAIAVASQAEAVFRQALELHRQARPAEAKTLYERVLELQPEHVPALMFLSVLALDAQQAERALELTTAALRRDPRNAAVHVLRGHAQCRLHRYDAALASYDSALVSKPDLAETHYHRGLVLAELKRQHEAIASFEQTIRLNPCHAEAHCSRGNVLNELGWPEAALASYDRAIALNPDYVDAHCNRGNVLYAGGQLDAAIASMDRAVAIDPSQAQANFTRSFFLLARGDLDEGWTGYEWRWRVTGTLTFQERRHFPEPRWTGEQSLAGKTIFIHREQGLGDALQFCRYLPLLAQLGARVILEIHKPLLTLFANLAGVSHLLERGDSIPAFDYWCPLLSLPLAFKTRIDTIPATSSYIRSDTTKVKRWCDTLGEKNQPRVGLVWNGGSVHPNDHNRSMGLADWLEFLPEGFQYVCLQQELRECDRLLIEAHGRILSPGSELLDFSDTAALCENMDLVISVDTSVAHLSGAMGLPTWILLPFSPDWRWLLGRDDSPWYPTVTLYRQRVAGDWRGVLERVRVDLLRTFDSAIARQA